MSQPNQQPTEIKLADNIPGADYANFMQVSHTKEEFLMMFANVAGLSGRVIGKIITSPGHLKRIIKALQDNVKMYEDKFGAITEAEAPAGKEIGFTDK
ncbi:MAG: DUF3467 domain-containing protein [Patescibacteria group bacterium]|jgi:hypothetical protein